LLALFNKLALGAQQVKDAKWNREAVRGTQLSGKTVGIIGFGHTGPAFASVLSGFDVRIPVYDKYKEINAERLGKAAIIPSTMEEVIKESDIISFNLPLTNETESMINADLIRQMKKGVIIINAARGKLVIMDDVIENISFRSNWRLLL
jgi:D-3-phosphoglycerate dehydrogenase